MSMFAKCQTIDEIMAVIDNDNRQEREAEIKLLMDFQSRGIDTPAVDMLKMRYPECADTGNQ